MTATYLVQDIETVPETEIQDMWEEEKVVLEGRGKNHDFPPIWAHKIICIGMLALDENLKPLKGGCAAGGCQAGLTEKAMIEKWSLAASGELFQSDKALAMVDWYGRGFDVPVLQTRAFAHGIRLPWYFGLLPDNRGQKSSWSKSYRDRYNGRHHDVAELWTNHGSFQRPHMANLARLMGLPGKVGIDGGKVHEEWIKGNLAGIDIYCMQDVFQTAFIYQRYCFVAGKITLEHYQDAADELIKFVKTAPDQEEFAKQIKEDVLTLRV